MHTPRPVAPYAVGVFYALIAAFGFSLKAIFIKLAYVYGVGAIALLALRMLFSLPAFLWVGLKASRRAPRLTRGDWLRLVLLGLLGFYGASMFDFLGLRYISAGLERIILFTYPILTLLIVVFFQGKTLTRRDIFAVTLCYAGIITAFAHDITTTADWTHTALGAGLVLLSSLCFAFYLAGSSRMIQQLGVTRFTALAMLVSTLATLLHYAAVEPLHAVLAQPWQVYSLALAMAIVSTILPAFTQTAAISRIGASRTALIGACGPVLTIFFGWQWLNEAISAWQIVGMSLVIAGVFLASRPTKS